MKKNLILFIAISLIAVGFVSAFAWPSWSSGKAIDSGKEEITQAREGQITMFEGEIREVEGHVITIISIGDTSSTIDVDGTSQEINEGSSGTINGFQLTLVNTFESWWRRNNVVIKTGFSGNEIAPGTPVLPVNYSLNDSLNDSIIEPVEGEVTYAGVLDMLNSCEMLQLEGIEGTCSQACNENYSPSKICALGGFEQIDVSGTGGYAPNQLEWRMNHPFSCNDNKYFNGSSINVFCICC